MMEQQKTKMQRALFFFFALSLPLAAEVATKEKPLPELKIGEKTYTKVYVHTFQEKTGKVILEHEWGSKGVKLESLSAEQKKSLGVKSTLTAKELEKNRILAKQKRAESAKKLAALEGLNNKQKGKVSAKGKRAPIKYKKVVTKRRVG